MLTELGGSDDDGDDDDDDYARDGGGAVDGRRLFTARGATPHGKALIVDLLSQRPSAEQITGALRSFFAAFGDNEQSALVCKPDYNNKPQNPSKQPIPNGPDHIYVAPKSPRKHISKFQFSNLECFEVF